MKSVALKPWLRSDGTIGRARVRAGEVRGGKICTEQNDRSSVVVGEVPHVFSDGDAVLILAKYPDKVGRIEDVALTPYRGENLAGKTLMIWRTGGYGDLLFITPAMRRLKKIYPTCRIWFGTRHQYQMVLRGNPDVSRVITMPFPTSFLEKVDYHLHFEGAVEQSRDPRLHAVDIFGKRADVTFGEGDRMPIYAQDQARTEILRRELVREGLLTDVPLVGVQARSSSPIRNYPQHLLLKVIQKLARKGHQVAVFGLKGDFPKGARQRGVLDLCGRYPEMADTVAVLAACDLLVAPDSSLVHFAAALRIPTVALYGPFPGRIRTLHYPLCRTLEVDGKAWPCAPCMIHSQQPCREARKRGQAWSPCFETITPQAVVEAVLDVLNTKESQP